jgi:cardiolipin synthase
MDHPPVRRTSRCLFGQLRQARVRLFECQPLMLHQKLMVVDRPWSVLGTMIIDMMSFEYLDERCEVRWTSARAA